MHNNNGCLICKPIFLPSRNGRPSSNLFPCLNKFVDFSKEIYYVYPCIKEKKGSASLLSYSVYFFPASNLPELDLIFTFINALVVHTYFPYHHLKTHLSNEHTHLWMNRCHADAPSTLLSFSALPHQGHQNVLPSVFDKSQSSSSNVNIWHTWIMHFMTKEKCSFIQSLNLELEHGNSLKPDTFKSGNY